MAFKMKGSYHYGKNPLKQRIGQMIAYPQEEATQESFPDLNNQMYKLPELIPSGDYPEARPKTQVEKQRLRKEKMRKRSAVKFDDTVKGKSKKVAKHPLYDKLPSWAKTAYNKLSAKERANVNKNKSESQLLNSLGDYTPKFEGGD